MAEPVDLNLRDPLQPDIRPGLIMSAWQLHWRYEYQISPITMNFYGITVKDGIENHNHAP